MALDAIDGTWCIRDPSKDIVAKPSTVYTDSTTLTAGMKLYDNTGTDTELKIGTVNQDGSFDIMPAGRTLTITNGQYSITTPTSYTVTDQDGNTILTPTSNIGDVMTANISNSVTSIIITNLTSGNPNTSGRGVAEFSVTNCTATQSEVNGSYPNTLTLSDFTGDPSVTLTFSYGPSK